MMESTVVIVGKIASALVVVPSFEAERESKRIRI